MSNREFEGRVALVTGGSRGIGRACCRKLADAGAAVAINYRAREADALETARLITADGGVALTVQADVSRDDEVRRMTSTVEEKLGPIDLLVNNAGIFHVASHAETTPEMWRETLETNLTSAYLVTWAVKDQMLARRFGRIVNMSSISALRARPNAIAYAVSKAGLIAFTQSLSEALAEYNIRVNAVAPGLIDTEILHGVQPEVLQNIVQATPMKRMGAPEEIAELVVFLLSERSSFMTGQTLVASGGRVLLP